MRTTIKPDGPSVDSLHEGLSDLVCTRSAFATRMTERQVDKGAPHWPCHVCVSAKKQYTVWKYVVFCKGNGNIFMSTLQQARA